MTYVVIIAVILIIIYFSKAADTDKKNRQSKSTRTNNDIDLYTAATWRENKTQTSSSNKTSSPIQDNQKWELVRRKSERWNQLGFGEGENFPGYGKLYDREFEVWYIEVGSKEKKNTQTYRDRNPLHYDPKKSESITGEGVFLERLFNTKEYESLYSGLDKKNRKRWYFALIKYSPTGIETDRALEVESEPEEIKEEIIVPEGWNLVRRKSHEWFKNGFGDDELFPGYGKIYERTFDVWYCKIGSKEKVSQPEFKDKAILKFYNGICGDLGQLKGKNLNFEYLSKTQGYEQLITTVDNKERKRWYFGLKSAVPTNIYTASAD